MTVRSAALKVSGSPSRSKGLYPPGWAVSVEVEIEDLIRLTLRVAVKFECILEGGVRGQFRWLEDDAILFHSLVILSGSEGFCEIF